MLSSIASFLPSALNIGGHSNHDLPRPTVNPDTEDEEDDVEEVPPPGRDDPETQRAPRGKEKDGKLANEVCLSTFICGHVWEAGRQAAVPLGPSRSVRSPRQYAWY